MLASCPVSMLNQKPSDLGIPNQFKLDPSRSSVIVRSCQRDGAHLCKAVGARCAVYTLDPGGKVLPHHALKAIRSGKLVPQRDGIFGNDSQTWTARKLP